MACIRRLALQSLFPRIVVVDGLNEMLHRAVPKLLEATRTFPGHPQLDAFTDDIIDGQQSLRQKVTLRGQTHLLTTQRVLSNCRFDKRVALLQEWASMLASGGTTIVDIPHPSRDIGSVLVGLRYVSPLASTSTILGAFQTAEDQAFTECRQYAQDLAGSISLTIANSMPAQLPPNCIDCEPGFLRWFEGTRAQALIPPLSPTVIRWFHNRYARDMVYYYFGQGFHATIDIAAVVVAFQRPIIGPQAT